MFHLTTSKSETQNKVTPHSLDYITNSTISNIMASQDETWRPSFKSFWRKGKEKPDAGEFACYLAEESFPPLSRDMIPHHLRSPPSNRELRLTMSSRSRTCINWVFCRVHFWR